jgi:hypothetical protein
MGWFKPDDFKNDPYGHWTNQVAHTMQVGLIAFVYGVTLIYWWIVGEFPTKFSIVAFAAVAYAAYELIDQGWRGWDTISDWIFVVVYGVAAPVYIFTEVAVGDTRFEGDLLTALPFVLIFTSHLFIGSLVRARRLRKQKDKEAGK